MIVWIIIIGVLIFAFVAKALVKLRRRKISRNYHPNINTRKKRFRFVNRFRHLEGLGDCRPRKYATLLSHVTITWSVLPTNKPF